MESSFKFHIILVVVAARCTATRVFTEVNVNMYLLGYTDI